MIYVREEGRERRLTHTLTPPSQHPDHRAHNKQCLAIVVASPKGLAASHPAATWAEEQARLVRWLTAPTKPPTAADDSTQPPPPAVEAEGGKAWTGITGLYIWVRGWSVPWPPCYAIDDRERPLKGKS